MNNTSKVRISATLSTSSKDVNGEDASSYIIDCIDYAVRQHSIERDITPHNTVSNGVTTITVSAKATTNNPNGLIAAVLLVVWCASDNYTIVKTVASQEVTQ